MSCRGVGLFQGEQQGCCESASGQDVRMRVPFEINQQRGNRVAARHRGGLSFGHFSLATQRKVARHQAK